MIRNGDLPQYNWHDIARTKQRLPKGDWLVWLVMAGRGFGKTRTGAETVMQLVESGKYRSIAIVGKTLHEARHIMVEGQSGIMSTALSANGNVTYYPSKRELVWANGAKAVLIGGDNYESIRGMQFDFVWIDEFAKFEKPAEVWEQVMLSLRIGEDPRCMITTTPKNRPIIRQLAEAKFCYVTNGTTYENKDNLSSKFLERIEELMQDTNFARQELYGEIVDDLNNLVWAKDSIKYKEVQPTMLNRIIIAVDPAVSNNTKSDETGIIIAGEGCDGNIYVLDDLSGKYNTSEWAEVVANAYHTYGASRVVAEVNNGGDMVENVMRNKCRYIPFSSVRAVKGKIARAEPVALLYSASKVFHVRKFAALEKQMLSTSYDNDKKQHDDRVDALVWGITELTNKTEANAQIIQI